MLGVTSILGSIDNSNNSDGRKKQRPGRFWSIEQTNQVTSARTSRVTVKPTPVPGVIMTTYFQQHLQWCYHQWLNITNKCNITNCNYLNFTNDVNITNDINVTRKSTTRQGLGIATFQVQEARWHAKILRKRLIQKKTQCQLCKRMSGPIIPLSWPGKGFHLWMWSLGCS